MLRAEFAKLLAPPQLFALLYSHRLAARRPVWLAELGRRFRSSRSLNRWVYGDSPLARNTAFLRIPSESKRFLIVEILRKVRPFHPWMTSRLLHAMAFREGWFSARPQLRTSGSSHPWGPLYRRVSIPKGSNCRRVLFIPSPPLKRVQRAILELITPHAAGKAPEGVAGVGGPRKTSIFTNAARHIGQHFVVSFDCADFFSSLRLDDVLRGIHELDGPMLTRELIAATDEPADSRPAKAPATKPLLPVPWRPDAVLLVAALCTYKRRLRQGPPTSPLMANIAFFPYDQRIITALGPNVIYSRYFDDITVSISRPVAQQLGVSSPAQFAVLAQTRVEHALRSTNIRLNGRKTRAGMLSEGVRVTGVQVLTDHVDVPRSLKRRVRELTHAIRVHGFVKTARIAIGQEAVENAEFRAGSPDRPEGHFLRRRNGTRRASTERLAVLMLRRLIPDLEIERCAEAEEGAGSGEHAAVYEGAACWKVVGRLLPYLWQNPSAIRRAGKSIEVGTLRLTGSRNLEFFCLSKTDAIKCTELYHRLRGLCAFLNVDPRDERFAGIRHLRETLSDCLGNLSLDLPALQGRGAKARVSGSMAAPIPALDQIDDIRRLAERVADLLDEYGSLVRGEYPANWAGLTSQLQQAAPDSNQLVLWLRAARESTLGWLPVLPPDRRSPATKAPERPATVFEFLYLAPECWSSERMLDYLAIEQFSQRHKLPDLFQASNGSSVQLAVLRSLRGLMEREARRHDSGSRDRWINMQCDNPYRVPLETRLKEGIDLFVEAHGRFCEVGSQRKVVISRASKVLRLELPLLRQMPSRSYGTTRLWAELEKAGLALYKVTFDALRPREQKAFEKVTFRSASGLTLVRNLRHRAAHAEPRNSEDIEKRLSARFRRILHRSPTHKAEPARLLPLKPIEALEIKIACVNGMTVWLREVTEMWASREDADR